MQSFYHPALRIERVRLTPATKAQLEQAIRVQPNLFLKINSSKEIEQIYLDLVFDQYLDQIKPTSLLDLFKQWDQQAINIVEQVQQKWGVDVALLGSNNHQKLHICKFCGKSFGKATALGGHTSKMHSSTNKIKIQASIEKISVKNDTAAKKKTIRKKTSSPKNIAGNKSLDMILQDPEEL